MFYIILLSFGSIYLIKINCPFESYFRQTHTQPVYIHRKYLLLIVHIPPRGENNLILWGHEELSGIIV